MYVRQHTVGLKGLKRFFRIHQTPFKDIQHLACQNRQRYDKGSFIFTLYVWNAYDFI
jgi:hypothetical protein